VDPMVFKVTVCSGYYGLSPQLGLEPASHTSEALAERYLNVSQLNLNGSQLNLNGSQLNLNGSQLKSECQPA
jgi:hypothetical protein